MSNKDFNQLLNALRHLASLPYEERRQYLNEALDALEGEDAQIFVCRLREVG